MSIEHIMVEMDSSGIPPTIETINLLLSAYAAKNDGSGAQTVFDEMNNSCIKPNNQSLGILINAYANQGNFAAVDGVLQKAMNSDSVLGTK